MLEIRGIWLCHMSGWDRYVLHPRVRAETSGSETVPHIGPYRCPGLGVLLEDLHFGRPSYVGRPMRRTSETCRKSVFGFGGLLDTEVAILLADVGRPKWVGRPKVGACLIFSSFWILVFVMIPDYANIKR